ncbi:acyltransferase [Vibrio fluvialis]|nr:acyltransferase [Vibrio fluvialis]
MKFRYDINGLRAIAVIAVVLFHFNANWVMGGFAGVDVFFVISGYLMTGIIFSGLDLGEFSLWKFYVSRAKRIIPPLAVLCFVLLLFGLCSLTLLDFQTLSKHVASSLLFISNLIFWREAGYFDVASNEKWLLHTWSLSVEWQFYIIYPMVLLGLKKVLSVKWLKRLVVIGVIISFLFSLIFTTKWPDFSYYALPTRAWEMMFGGLAFLFPLNLTRMNGKAIEVLGIFIIASSFFLVSESIAWPGYAALFPVLGTYLVIVSNQQKSVLTNNRISQSLGKWSYSIYLWHWPLVVYGSKYNNEYWPFFGVLLSILLGYISFRFIESRKVLHVSSWKVLYLASFFLAFFSVYTYQVYQKQHNYTFDKKHFDSQVWQFTNSFKEVTSFEKTKILILGDSQGADITRIFREIPYVNMVSKSTWTECGIPFVDEINRDSFLRSELSKQNKLNLLSGCSQQMEVIASFLAQNKPDKIFVAYIWRDNRKFQDFITTLKSITDAEIVVFGRKDFLVKNSYEIIEDSGKYQGVVSDEINNNVIAMNDDIKSISIKSKVDFFDFKDLFCDFNRGKQQCIAEIDGIPIFYDKAHFTIDSIPQIAEKYKKYFDAIIY